MDDCMLADLVNFDDVLTGQQDTISDDDVANLNSSLMDDIFRCGGDGGSGGDFEADLESLLSSLTPPSSHSDETMSQSSPAAHVDQDEDFRMTDLLGYVLDDDNDHGEDAVAPAAAQLTTGLEDHDYSRPDDGGGHQEPRIGQAAAVVESLSATTEEELNEFVAPEVEQQKVEEIVVQTVQIMPSQQRPQQQQPTPRKYITILPAQSKTQIQLVGGAGDSSSESSTTSPVAPKRRRLQGTRQLKAYPALILTQEEKELCQKDGISLPEYYPLTKSEESDLRKIRRKIRNKISAQKSRGRKKEYVDDMEARAKLSETENKQLKKKVAVLEAQNKTLISQLQKMRSLLASSKPGLGGQKSATALMVLLLSTALFAVPGFKEQYGGKTDLGTVERASASAAAPGAGVTPPRASRSLLHYIGNGELGGSYPNIVSPQQQSSSHSAAHKYKAQTQQPFDVLDKEKTKLELMESLNFSKELLANIRRQQQQGSDQQQLNNKTKIVTTAEVKSYSNNAL